MLRAPLLWARRRAANQRRRRRSTIRAMRPGDLIGFSSDSALARGIQYLTCGLVDLPISHVAMVVANPKGIGLPERHVLAESTTSLGADQPCLLADEEVDGVQFHPIGRRMRKYRGPIWWYPLAQPRRHFSGPLKDCWLRARWRQAVSDYHDAELCATALRSIGWFLTRIGTRPSPRGLCRSGVRGGVLSRPLRV